MESFCGRHFVFCDFPNCFEMPAKTITRGMPTCRHLAPRNWLPWQRTLTEVHQILSRQLVKCMATSGCPDGSRSGVPEWACSKSRECRNSGVVSSWSLVHGDLSSSRSSLSSWAEDYFMWQLLACIGEILVRWGWKIKYHLTAHFQSSITTKNYQNRSMFMETIASQSSVVFWDSVVYAHFISSKWLGSYSG